MIYKLKNDPDHFDLPKLRLLRKELGKPYKEEEAYWKQKSRALWLQERDKNTSFFHMKTIQRRKCNSIKGFCLANGNWVSKQGDIIREVENYYENLFTTSRPTNLDPILNLIPRLVEDCINQSLTREVTDEKVKHAVFEMHPLKAPGIDGMTFFFFQNYWNVLSTDIIAIVKSFFLSRYLLPSWNQTLITLIPKVKNPSVISQFRPISLCFTI